MLWMIFYCVLHIFIFGRFFLFACFFALENVMRREYLSEESKHCLSSKFFPLFVFLSFWRIIKFFSHFDVWIQNLHAIWYVFPLKNLKDLIRKFGRRMFEKTRRISKFVIKTNKISVWNFLCQVFHSKQWLKVHQIFKSRHLKSFHRKKNKKDGHKSWHSKASNSSIWTFK